MQVHVRDESAWELPRRTRPCFFLRKHLLEWAPERAARHDYRVLSLDAYPPHLSPDIITLAWERGYISHEGLMVPGGATGVVQGPDTDLHAWLEKELIGLQEASTSAQLSVRPRSTPSETRQSTVDYAIALWEMADHKQGVKSFKRNGLNEQQRRRLRGLLNLSECK